MQRDDLPGPLFYKLYVFYLPYLSGIRVVSNAGGINPHACAQAIREISKKSGIEDLKVAVVSGDNLLEKVKKRHFFCHRFIRLKQLTVLHFFYVLYAYVRMLRPGVVLENACIDHLYVNVRIEKNAALEIMILGSLSKLGR